MKKSLLTLGISLFFCNVSMAWGIGNIVKAATHPVQIVAKTVAPVVTHIAAPGEKIITAGAKVVAKGGTTVVTAGGKVIAKGTVTVVKAGSKVVAKGGEIIIAPARIIVKTVPKATNNFTIQNVIKTTKQGINSLNNLKNQIAKAPAEVNKDINKANDLIKHSLNDLNTVLDDYAKIQTEINKLNPEQTIIDDLQNDAQNELNHVTRDLKGLKELDDDAATIEQIAELIGG